MESWTFLEWIYYGPIPGYLMPKGLSRNETGSHIGLGPTGKMNRLTENRIEKFWKLHETFKSMPSPGYLMPTRFWADIGFGANLGNSFWHCYATHVSGIGFCIHTHTHTHTHTNTTHTQHSHTHTHTHTGQRETITRWGIFSLSLRTGYFLKSDT